jgi:RNA polymerase sigma-70 factor (ECF subfamily)
MTENLTLEQEREMVSGLQTGNMSSATLLYQQFSTRLFRQVIISRLPNLDQAEDVLCETFRIALEKISSYTVIDRSIFFWLRRIAINLVIQTYRKQVRKRELAERILARNAVGDVIGTTWESPDRGLEREDAKEMVEESLTRLKPRYAQVLRLRLLQDRSREECAEELGITINNFDVLFHRACKSFRDNYPP